MLFKLIWGIQVDKGKVNLCPFKGSHNCPKIFRCLFWKVAVRGINRNESEKESYCKNNNNKMHEREKKCKSMFIFYT